MALYIRQTFIITYTCLIFDFLYLFFNLFLFNNEGESMCQFPDTVYLTFKVVFTENREG